MHAGAAAILPLLALLAVSACGNAAPPATRTNVERGTALPPPGLVLPATARR